MNDLPTPYYDRDGTTIYVGDNREVLPHIEPVHAVCEEHNFEAEREAEYEAAHEAEYTEVEE